MGDTLVIVLSGRRSVETLKRLGYRVGIVNDEIPLDLTLLADVPIEANLEDREQVAQALRRVNQSQRIAAVVTQLESLVPLAGYLRTQLGLSTGISEEAALNCRDKANTRRLLEAAGVPSARFRIVDSVDRARDAATEIGLPVVVKPRDASSAAYLMLARTTAEVEAAAAAILEGGRTSMLVEEFLIGSELLLFVSRAAGRMRVLSCLDIEVGPPPKFVRLGARLPSTISPDQAEAVRRVTDACLEAIGLDNWVATVQLMVTADGPRIIEVNPRVPGGQLVTLIEATAGVDPTQVGVEAALGIESRPDQPRVPRAWYRCLTFERAGLLFYRPEAEDGSIPGIEGPLSPFVEIDVAPGEMVLPINHSRGGVFGRFILFGNSDDQLARDHQRVLDALDLRLEPVAEAEADAAWRPHSRCC